MRIGVFGGSFDPIHLGHLILAENCREQANLDQVLFIPCAVSPHKKDGAHSTSRQRIEMIELALSGHESFVLSKLEIDRGEISYTVDTLSELLAAHPDDELFLLMGDDSLESFPNWREPKKIVELATPLVVNRPGSGNVDLSVLESYVDQERYKLFQSMIISSPRIEISSSQIRKRVRDNQSIRFLVPRSVEKYVETQKLFTGN
ncbi:MAG: nicotinate-nucleotide adenylyltransferase [Mariniblastus sp.]|nr:nicotinate-nucleotide adenylyltransferase [Mariniblastus sp.]